MSIKIGLSANPIPPLELTIGTAVNNEADGYDSLWYPDHLMGWFPKALWTRENSSIVDLLPSPHIYLDPMVVIGILGQVTKRVKLATGVTDPIRRPPGELARTFLTLSHATQGRAILGIGAGERENTEAYGLDFTRQVSKLEEALEIIARLWAADGPIDFDGRFWKLRRAVIDLQPFEGVFPEIWIGAHGPRMLNIVGRYADGWYPSYPMSPQEYASKLDVIRKAASEAGRDPSAIQAGYQMYCVVADDHETTHRILSSPLAAAMTLVAPSSQWEKAGLKHPMGSNFEGLRDYVPEWYSKEELEAAVASFDIAILHDTVVHGTTEEVVSQIEPFIEAGLQHAVFANLAPIAGFEFVPAAQMGMKKVADILRA
ncbi:MAG: LLM class flavin-dependent oxidoreductase [Actinomycetota bacterium]